MIHILYFDWTVAIMCKSKQTKPQTKHTHTNWRLKEIYFIPHKGLWVYVFFQVISRLGWWFKAIKCLFTGEDFPFALFLSVYYDLKTVWGQNHRLPLAGLWFKNMPLLFLVPHPAFEPSPGLMHLGHSGPCSFGHGVTKLSCLSPT